MKLVRPLQTLVVVSTFGASPAFALEEAKPRDPAAAEALYKTARDLLAKEDWEGACPKFGASMELDPVASTLINVAKCSERDGKLAQAWTELKRAQVLNQETQGEERKRTLQGLIDAAIQDIERRLPKLSLVVTPRPDGLTITRNGIAVPLAALEESIPLDPGDHRLVVSAPGYDTVERVITVDTAKLVAVDVRLSEARVSVGGPPAAKARQAETAAAIPVWPFITGGLGLLAIGAGVGFRIDGMTAEANLDENCGEARRCDPAGAYDPSDDNQRKNVDFGAFMGLTIGGGAMLLGTAIGIIVEVTASPSEAKEESASVTFIPLASETSVGLGIAGSFK